MPRRLVSRSVAGSRGRGVGVPVFAHRYGPERGISASDPWFGPVDGHHDKAVSACPATGTVRVVTSTARRAVRWVGRVGGHSVFAGC